MKFHYLIPALLIAGCAQSHPPTAAGDPGPLPQKHVALDVSTVRTPEEVKAYPVGRYSDPANPDVMHEGHTIYRAESSPVWDTDPNAPTDLPLGPGEMAEADPAQQHTALTADLEQRLKQEDQLLQTTYEQNERLAQEIRKLEEQQQHTLLPVPPPATPAPAPQPKPQTSSSPQPSPVTSTPAPQNPLWSWLWLTPTKTNNK